MPELAFSTLLPQEAELVSESFDPYRKWLGIPAHQQPPHHYRLLGIELFENDAEIISHAADRQMSHVRTFQTGRHAEVSQRLLSEVAAARVCLLNAERKAAYDNALRQTLSDAAGSEASSSVPSDTAPPPSAKPTAQARPIAQAKPLAQKNPNRSLSPTTPARAKLNPANAPTDVPAAAEREFSPRQSTPDPRLLAGIGVAVLLVVAVAVWFATSGGEDQNIAARIEPSSSVPAELETQPSAGPRNRKTPPRAEPDSPQPSPGKSTAVDPPPPRAVTKDPASRPAETSRPLPSQPESPSAEPPTGIAEAPDPESPGDLVRRLPIPKADAQTAAQTTIDEVFGNDIQAARSPAAMSDLSRRLLEAARENDGRPAAAYLLLETARRLAVAAADSATAFEAVGLLAARFEIDDLAVKSDSLAELKQTIRRTDQREAFARTVLAVVGEAVAADRVDLAVTLVDLVRSQSSRIRTVDLRKRILSEAERVAVLKKRWDAAQQADEVLAADPDNAAANLAKGRYLALTLGNWDDGIRHLAKGPPEPLAELARRDQSERELASPTEPPVAGVELGDGWYDWAQSADDEFERNSALARALFWYRRVRPVLVAAEAKRIETRIDALAKIVTPIAAAGGMSPLAWVDGEVGEIRRFVGHENGSYSNALAVARDGSPLLFSTALDKTVRLWNARDGQQIGLIDIAVTSHCLAITPDSRQVLVGGQGSLTLWDAASRRQLRSFTGHTGTVNSLAISPDGRLAVSNTFNGDETVRLWDLASGREIGRFSGRGATVFACFSSDGRKVMTGDSANAVVVWNVETFKQLGQFEGHSHLPRSANLLPDGESILSCSEDSTLRLWNWKSGQELRRFVGHNGKVFYATLSPDGRRALSAGEDSTVRLWDIETGLELHRFTGHVGQVWSVTFTPDGRGAFSSGSDRVIRLWRLPEPSKRNRKPSDINTPPGFPPIVCRQLAAKAAPRELATTAAAFTGPRGDGRSGRNGFLIPAPKGWEARGTIWSCMFRRDGSARGIQFIHPFAGGHVQVNVGHNALNASFPANGRSVAVQMQKPANFAQRFVLGAQPQRLTSVVKADGTLYFYLDRDLVAAGKILNPSPIRLDAGYAGAGLPGSVKAGTGGVIIGPRDNGFNIAENVGFGVLD